MLSSRINEGTTPVALSPSLHKPIPMETRVRTRKESDTGFPPVTGTVVGVASMHVIFNYIVLLDFPWDGMRAISVPGTLLESEDGSTNWLDS